MIFDIFTHIKTCTNVSILTKQYMGVVEKSKNEIKNNLCNSIIQFK